MGYQESWLYIEPQHKFKKLIQAYEKAEQSGYYEVAGAEPNVTKLSQNTPLHSKLSCNGALFCVFSKKHLTNMQFRAAILLSTLSKMALVVRSVSRHKNYKEDYL